MAQQRFLVPSSSRKSKPRTRTKPRPRKDRYKDCGTWHGLLRAREPEEPVHGLRHAQLRARAPEEPVHPAWTAL
jgi:hypothetical protein